MPETNVPAKDRPYIGGQAVLEGVMMRSPSSFAVAVRRADGSISIKERPVEKKVNRWAKIPLARGMATLVESLRLGSEALRFSAEQMEKDMVEEEASAAPAQKSSKSGEVAKKISSTISHAFTAFGLSLAQLVTRADGDGEAPATEEKRSASPMALMTIIMVAFMIALPQLLAWGASSLFH